MVVEMSIRFFIYGFIFCLSFYWFANPITSSATDQSGNAIQKANRLIQEYGYKDLPLRSLRTIYGLVDILREQHAGNKVGEVHIHGFEGTFYILSSGKNVLYVPPKRSEYMLGRGCHKKVYRGLYFSKEGAEVVAACVGDKTVLKEAEVLKSLSLPGEINPYRTSFSLPSKCHMLVLRYYNMGSCSSLRKKSVHLEDKQKIQVARDTLSSLMAMHKRSFVHLDLHDGNVLIHRLHDGSLVAGLIDFGRAMHMYAKSERLVQGASKRNPPEVFLMPMNQVSKKASDIYAMGCFLFSLFFDRDYEGSLIFDKHTFQMLSPQEKEAAYAQIQEAYASEYTRFTESLQGKEMTELDRFKKTVFQMIHPDPEKRIDLNEALISLQSCSAL